MLSGGIGISSPGQFAPGAIGKFQTNISIIPSAFDRSFLVPQNGLPWDGAKVPQSIENFSFNWAGEIGDDLIVSSAWQLQSSDIAENNSAVDAAGAITTILISNGVAGNIYNVTNLITTESGLKLSATFRLFVNSYNW